MLQCFTVSHNMVYQYTQCDSGMFEFLIIPHYTFMFSLFTHTAKLSSLSSLQAVFISMDDVIGSLQNTADTFIWLT